MSGQEKNFKGDSVLEFTQQEKAQQQLIEDKYEKTIEALTKVINTSPKGSARYEDAREEWDGLLKKYNEERSTLVEVARLRQFNELGNDPLKISDDAKRQASQVVYEVYHYLNDSVEEKSLLEWTHTRNRILGVLQHHFNALQNNTALSEELITHIEEVLNKSQYVVPKGEKPPKFFITVEPVQEKVKTSFPKALVFPIDKVTGKTFGGDLLGVGKKLLAMEKAGSKTQISTAVQIDFDNISGVTMDCPGGLTEYDREVHNAIISQHIEENTHFTPQMIYQALTGNPEARLEEKQTEAIRQSLNKLMVCRITIDASEEAKARGQTKFKLEGPLISWNKLTVELNGTSVECYRLLQIPLLYQYAHWKNQIARADIKLLNSPINKTEEVITLQGYLMRRIMAIKGKSRLNPSILYEAIYEHLQIKASSPGALRKKKSILRTKIKTILDYWVTQKFIIGYRETIKATVAYSIEIDILSSHVGA